MASTALNKIVAPVLPPNILHRESLVTRLYESITAGQFSVEGGGAYHKLILLCAPAGYGKTTLLADFARSTGIPCCWYFLDQNDTDRYTFLSGLLTSIRYRFPGFGATLDPFLALAIGEASALDHEDGAFHFEAFIDALVSALSTEITQRFALLLCNYHEVDESQAITNLINYLLQRMPPQCVLIIESRATPSIEFVSLLAHRQAIGLGSNMLRMDAEEILALARVQGVTPPSRSEAEQLARAFDGWVAGILLGTRLGDAELLYTGTRTGILQGLPSMRVEREKLFAYLVDEIFQRQPAAYAFLKEAAILQQMIPAQCDVLLGITNSSEHLVHLVRQGMFVSCSDDGFEAVYTCHPVLRELLCDELRHRSPERFAELHRQAAELFAASHDYDKAISHVLAAGDSHRAARLIIQAHEQMSTRERAEVVLHWIDALPPTIVESYPQLLLIRASIYIIRNEYYQVFPLLDLAASALRTNTRLVIDPSDLPRLQTEILILRSKVLFQAGQYQEAQRLCEQVLEATPMDEVAMRAESHARFGMCANLLGDMPSSIEHLQKALQLWGRHIVQLQTADAHSVLAISYNQVGNFALAEHHLSRAIDCCNQLHDEKGKVNNLIRMAIHKQRQGAFAEAEAILTQILTTARNTPGFEREESYILVNLGSIYQDEGRYDQSLKMLEEGLGLTRQLRDNYLTNCCLCYLAMTYLLMGDASTATLLLSETNLPAHGESIGYEQAIHDLTYGAILFYQKRYDETCTFFTALEASLKKAGLKRELLRVKVRLGACQLAQRNKAEAIHHLHEITSILENQDYGQVVLLALHRHPAIQKLVKTLPELEELRTLLNIEPSVQESEEAPPTKPAAPAPLRATTIEPKLKIQAFGEPAVFLDGRPITRWRMARSMELFFFLLDSGRPMRKEQIITALWPQVDDQINQTFHSTIYYLRKAVNESYVVSHGGIYSLDLSSLDDNMMQYDVALFKEQYTQAKQFLASQNDEEAKAALLAMVELYQGDYVQPFYCDWCSFRRDELRRVYLEARNLLAHIAWRQEEFDESAVHWQHMLAMDNWIEEAHYGLMKYYIRTGKRGLALRQYQRCVETLQEELGAQPGQAVQSLYQRIMSTSEQMKRGGKTSTISKETSGTR